MFKIDYVSLQELVNKHTPIIKKDLGIEDVDVSITLVEGPCIVKGAYPLGYLSYMENRNNFIVKSFSERAVTVYPANIMKICAHTLTKHELASVVVEALAHELRHVYQLNDRVGSMAFNVDDCISYEQRPKEVDARWYGKQYVLSNSLTCLDDINRIRKVAINVIANIAGLAIGLGIRYMINKNKKK